jgi:cell shape-determining protein MreC
VPANLPAATSATAKNGDRASRLLEGLKEELFELEIERQQGKISEAEYQKTKAALDETLRRAIARKSETSA